MVAEGDDSIGLKLVVFLVFFRAGCPLWVLCWAHVALSGCCCEVEAPLGHEPGGLIGSSS